MNAILQDLPLPARLVPWPKAPPTTLTKCVALALLLHVWLVLLLGNAPGGTAQPGQGVGGAINVTLRGPVSDGAATVVVPAAPANATPGEAAVPRWGGAVRSSPAEPAPLPGAARLGELSPRAVPEPDAPPPVAPAVSPPAAPAPPGRVLEERAAPVLQERTAPVSPPITPEPAPAEPPLRAPPLPSAPAPQPALAASPPPLPTAVPLPTLPALPAPSAVIAVPRPDRQLASPLTQPAVPAAASTSAPLPSAAAPVTLPELAAPPLLADAPPALRQLQAPAPAAAPTLQPALPRSTDLAPLATPLPAASAGTALPTARAAAVDGGAQVGHDVATPPAAAASGTPRLNLQLSRPRGGELSRFSTSGALPVLPRPPERDEKLAREIEKAGKPDCRSAYAGLGPLAVIPLAVDAVRKDGGCKW